jgi:hypothetical protein
MIFKKVKIQFQIRFRIQIHNLEFRIQILEKVSDPCEVSSSYLRRSNITSHLALGLTSHYDYTLFTLHAINYKLYLSKLPHIVTIKQSHTRYCIHSTMFTMVAAHYPSCTMTYSLLLPCCHS